MFSHFLISCLVHLFLLIAVNDTYFRSSIELDLPLTNSTNSPAAKRVVLIIVDGLRARAIFGKNEKLTPFLTSIRVKGASWGISRGKPPTESRVGHTAIVAGFREDPRAMLNGWTYPVRYDSVLENSRHSWVFGACNRLADVFEKYATKNVKIFSTAEYVEKLRVGFDEWSVSTLRSTLNNSTIVKDLTESKNLFVVLLPDMDTIGHEYVKNYTTAVSGVDRWVEEISRIINEYFKDNSTSFLFTSDHGMFRKGHGTGSEDEVSSPFQAWGAGIKINEAREDLENIDIAPLISALLGIHFPTNSLGKLPINYLDLSNAMKLQVFSNNLVQILEIFKAKEERLSKIMFMRRNILDDAELDKVLLEVNGGNVEKALNRCRVVHEEISSAIRKIHVYFTCDILVLSFVYLLFWLIFLLLSLVDDNNNTNDLSMVFGVLLVIFHGFLLILYRFIDIFATFCLLPFCTFSLCLYKLKRANDLHKVMYDLPSFPEIVVFLAFIYSVVLGLHHRSLLFVTALLMAPIMSFIRKNMKEEGPRNIWIALCLILSGFPLITKDIEWNMDGTNYYLIGSFIWHFLIGCILRKLLDSIRLSKMQIAINSVQLLCSLVMSFSNFLELDQDILFYVALIPVLLVTFSMKSADVRLATIFMAFATVYSVEAKPFALIFLTFFAMLLLTWKMVETEKVDSASFVHFRNVWIVVGANILGFLGIVNLDSIKIPFTQPSLQMDLIQLSKLLTPLIFTCCVFRYIVSKVGVDLKVSFIIMELLFGFMIFHFMCAVANTGSWAVMGTSFVRFNIVNFFGVGFVSVYSITYFLMDIGSSEVLKKLNLLLN